MVILQFSSDVSPSIDGTSAFTPSSTVGHHVPGSVTAESESHGLDAGSSDASLSSREHTDASSVDSLDVPVPSTEKRKSKSKSKSIRLRSLKDTVSAMYQKRKSVATPTAHADDLALSGRSPEAPRRSSAPQERPSTNRLCLPVPSRLADCPPLPDRQHRLLQTSKSDGPITPPTEDEGLDVVDSPDAPQTAPVLLHKPDAKKLMIKMNRKIRTCLQFMSKVQDRPHPVDKGDAKVHVIDLSSEDVPVTPSVLALTYSELLQLGRS